MPKIILYGLLITGPVFGFVLEDVRWGFDGKILPERVNILNVWLYNNGSEPFEGEVYLTQGNALSRVDAILARDVYLGAGQKRWLQFTPYVPAHTSGWELRWGKRMKNRVSVRAPQSGLPAVCVLTPRNTPRSRRFPSFREEFFPTSVCATDALHALVMGHVPEWEPSRESAFLDWLNRGGVVHLCAGELDAALRFEGALSVLNEPANAFGVGNGRVVRHRQSIDDFTIEDLKNAGFPMPFWEINEQGLAPYADTSSQGLFTELAQAVSPNHDWGLIYLLAGIYLILVAPVNYLIGRKAKRHWWSLGFFLLVVTVFAFIMSHVGRQGYGTSGRTYAVGYARDLGNGRVNVVQWASAFVTKGKTYRIEPPAEQSVLSAAQPNESVDGVIRNGARTSFEVDVPIFSRRRFVHHGVWAYDFPKVRFEDLNRFTIDTDVDILEVIAVGPNGNMFSVSRDGDQWRIDQELSQQEHQQLWYPRYGKDRSITDIARIRILALTTEGLPITRNQLNLPPAPKNQYGIFIAALAPQAFDPAPDTFDNYSAVVVFHAIAQAVVPQDSGLPGDPALPPAQP